MYLAKLWGLMPHLGSLQQQDRNLLKMQSKESRERFQWRAVRRPALGEYVSWKTFSFWHFLNIDSSCHYVMKWSWQCCLPLSLLYPFSVAACLCFQRSPKKMSAHPLITLIHSDVLCHFAYLSQVGVLPGGWDPGLHVCRNAGKLMQAVCMCWKLKVTKVLQLCDTSLISGFWQAPPTVATLVHLFAWFIHVNAFHFGLGNAHPRERKKGQEQ